MIALTSTDSLTMKLSGAATSVNPYIMGAYVDSTIAGGITVDSSIAPTQLNGSTPVTVVAAPAAGTTRHIASLSLVNTDTGAITFSLVFTGQTLLTFTLAVGDVLQYSKAQDQFTVTSSTGAIKYTTTPTGAASGDLSGTYPSPTVAKINGTALSGLATGLLKNTTSTGVPSIATSADIPGHMKILNVKNDYGAKGDGSTDDTTAIQNAITAAIAGHSGRGVDLFFPEGIYRTTTTLTCNGTNVRLIGSGRGSTVLYPDFTTGDIIQFGNGGGTTSQMCGMMHMQIFAPSSHTSGYGININKSDDFHLEDFAFTNMFTAIRVQGTSIKVYIVNGTIDSCYATTGVGIEVVNGLAGDTYIDDVVFSNNPASKPAAGIRVTQTGHMRIRGCNVTSCLKGLEVNPGASQDATYIFASDTLLDSGGTHGIHIAPTNASGRARSMKFINCWAAGSGTNYGIEIGGVASSTVDDIEFVCPRVLNNYQHGVYISYASAQNIKFLGGTIAGNSVQGSNTYDGINAVANVNKVTVSGVTIGQAGTASNTQRYAINVAAGTSAEWVIEANTCTLNNTVPYINFAGTGAGNVISGNDPQASAGGVDVCLGATAATSGTGETLIHKALIPANSCKVGDTFRISVHGISSSTGTLIFRVKAGANGTTADTQAWISLTSAGQAANQRAGFDGLLVVRSIGGSGTVQCECLGYAQAALLPTVVAGVGTVTINTTANWYIDIVCTYSSGTWTAQSAAIVGI